MVIFVANVVLYLMAKQNVALAKADVELCDVANVYCEDETIRAKVEAIKVHRFRHEGEPRVVVSVQNHRADYKALPGCHGGEHRRDRHYYTKSFAGA